MAEDLPLRILYFASLWPVLRILVMAALGSLAAWKGILTKSARAGLNEATFIIFTPALLFVALAKAVSLEALIKWWPLVASNLWGIVIGYGLGRLQIIVLRPPRRLYTHVVVSSMLVNASGIPLVLVASLAVDGRSLFGLDDAADRGLAYVAINMITNMFAIFGLGHWMIGSAPKDELDDKIDHLQVINNHTTTLSTPLLQSEDPDLETAGKSSESPAQPGEDLFVEVFGGVDSESAPNLTSSTRRVQNSRRLRFQPAVYSPFESNELSEIPDLRQQSEQTEDAASSRMGQRAASSYRQILANFSSVSEKVASFPAVQCLRQVLSPPNIASLAGVTVGLVPYLQRLFIGRDAPFFFFTDALEVTGEATIPCLLVALGAAMYKGPGSGNVPARIVVGLAVVRLVIAPLLGVASVFGLYKLGLFQVPDRMFMLVLLSVHAMPTAMNMQLLASIHSSGELETATILFWQYVLCAFSIPLALFVILHLTLVVPAPNDTPIE